MSENKCKSWWIIYRFSRLDKNKKTVINQINKNNNKSFQNDTTLALNPKVVGENSERIKKKDDWKKVEKNDPKIAFNVLLYIKTMNIYPPYISKHNSNHEK